MCGIFGFTNYNSSKLDRARKSLQTLHHRGPDQWNDYFDKNIYMGHQRLSILDLSKFGRQPMSDPLEKVIISVNGEIYNFLELKEELKDKYIFKSTSDSEVVLYGYLEWGINKLLEKIDGMYAISIYDKVSEELFIIRDRVGIKPLYYGVLNNHISWASELKAIQEFYKNENILEYDYTAFYDFLTYLYIPTPKSMYKNIYKLEPGHYLKVDLKSNSFTKIKYWQLDITKSNDNKETAIANIFKLVEKSVKEQMISDVPVGFFLSGGMDSSTIVAMAAQNYKDINTFSIGFSDKTHDETYFANLVAEMYETKHLKKILNDDSSLKMIDNLIKWYDEPFGDTSCVPTYLVSKLAKETSTVVLTGDGGDEVFGGYKWYKKFEQLKKLQKVPFVKTLSYILKPFVLSKNIIGKVSRNIQYVRLENDLEIYTKLLGGMISSEKSEYKKKWSIPDDYDDYWYFKQFYNKKLPYITRLQYLDFNTYLPDDILTKVDRVSMAVSLECRVPFLKKEIIEYSFSLDESIRLANGHLKGIMKESFNKLLPFEIINRDKKGFSIPLSTSSKIYKDSKYRQENIIKDFINNEK